MRNVLDDDQLDGVFAAELRLRSARAAWTVSSYDAGTSLIETLCQISGGVADILVPAGSSDAYTRLLKSSMLDIASDDFTAQLAPGLSDNPFRRLPAVLALPDGKKYDIRPVQRVVLETSDPWHLAYVTTFGSLSEEFDAKLKSELMLREDLSLDEFVVVLSEKPESPGIEDLLTRLENRSVSRPLGLSLAPFAARRARVSDSALDGWLQDREGFARQVGRDVVVLYTPGNVADLCLAWNLRARHGWPLGLPLAIPINVDTPADPATVDVLSRLVARTGRRIMGWPVQLVSASVGADALEALVQALRDAGQEADVGNVADFLLPAQSPARTSRVPVVFSNGQAHVSLRTDRDRSDLRVLSALQVTPRMHLSVALDGDVVPPSPLLRRDDDFAPRFTDDGASVVADSDELRRIQWPTGWERLAAVCADLGIDAVPSASGRTALALLRQLGSINEMRWFAHRPLLALLYAKASSSGMSWWKKRATKIAQASAANASDPDAAMRAVTEAIANVSVSHGGESASAISFGELCQVLGKPAAMSWLAWAESRRLLVRGTVVRCPECQHEQWRLVSDLAPPLTCPGCRRDNERPFQDTSLSFSYRLSESLRRAIENDSIYHLLIARFLVVVLSSAPVPLVGMHPGVDLARDGLAAEADIVLLFGNGELVPVEVKTRSAGFKQHDLEMLDRVVGWFDGRASILAAGDTDDDMASLFTANAINGSLPVRRLLTCQDWLRQSPFVSMGSGYPGPPFIETDGQANLGFTAPQGLNEESRRPGASELDGQFAAAVIRLRPDQQGSQDVREKIKKSTGST